MVRAISKFLEFQKERAFFKMYDQYSLTAIGEPDDLSRCFNRRMVVLYSVRLQGGKVYSLPMTF